MWLFIVAMSLSKLPVDGGAASTGAAPTRSAAAGSGGPLKLNPAGASSSTAAGSPPKLKSAGSAAPGASYIDPAAAAGSGATGVAAFHSSRPPYASRNSSSVYASPDQNSEFSIESSMNQR